QIGDGSAAAAAAAGRVRLHGGGGVRHPADPGEARRVLAVLQAAQRDAPGRRHQPRPHNHRAGHYSLGTIRHILELHVVADYYDDKKLKQLSHAATAASTLFQRSGFAPGMAGYVNITQHRGGKVSFIVDDAADSVKPVTYVKQIESHRYDYSVLQVSGVLSSPEAEAPVAPPAPVNLTDILSKKYCKSFAGLLAADPKVFDTLNGTKDTALTVFCPVDAAVAAFMPKFKNLTAKAKTAILLYHAVPDYYSMQFLKSNKGKVTTLATTSVAKKDYTYEAE
uniref:FAS1 domain-containing protein n=1 Tax=Zea mays TaxID=4577 RepID=A0A804PZ97_MAIZE